MDYDPVKDRFAGLLRGSPTRTRWFFRLLHLFFLRAWYVRRELRREIDRLSDRSRLRMLDAGTGFGQFSWWVARHWPDVEIEAVDIKDDYLKRARDFFKSEGLADRVQFGVDDLTDLQADGPFDLILSVDVMEHIEEDEAVFRHFSRVLRPGGVVIINTPSDLGGSDVGRGKGGSFIGEHVRDGYNRKDLADKLERAGLSTSRALYTYGPAGSIAWRLWIKWPMRLLDTGWYLGILLPLYYLVVLGPGLVLNLLDMRSENARGTGLLLVAVKDDSNENIA